MDIPRIGGGGPGAQDRASHLQGEQPCSSYSCLETLHPTLQSYTRSSDPLSPPGSPPPSLPATRGIQFPCFLWLYLLGAEGLGPVVQNQALLGPMGGAGHLRRIGGLRRLGRIALQRGDGPPAAVGGGQVVGGRHDSRESEGGKKEAPAARLRRWLSLAQHHMASRSLPLSFAPSLLSP